jgi:hypothetical protein
MLLWLVTGRYFNVNRTLVLIRPREHKEQFISILAR